jgi:FtsP/CotA-like multicopper oxidase with cupredoxin domain
LRLDIDGGKWSEAAMTPPVTRPSRRRVLAGAGGLAAALLGGPSAASTETGPTRPALSLRLKPATSALRGELAPSPHWGFDPPPQALQFVQGDDLQIAISNDLKVPVALNWRGGDGAAAIEPLAVRPPLLAGQTAMVSLPLRQAGTAFCDARLLGDGQALALPAAALMVLEKPAVAVDVDQLLLIEDWRLTPDGGTLAPGADAGSAATVFTINGRPSLDLAVRTHQRLRLRFINGCQRAVIAVKIDDHEVRVMAIDGQPAEPFLARNGQLVLAPGTRIDAFVDAAAAARSVATIQLHDGRTPRPIARLVYGEGEPARPAVLPMPDPLPGNGLPQKLDLQSAQRVNLTLDARAGTAADEWLRPANLNATTAPAFRIKRGRVAVLTLSNRAATPLVFHLHGHHVRLLDRLDDGWKPFWLDTLVVEAGKTERLAFAAEHAGPWLMEAMGTDWAAPRLARWYMVE